jgi:nitroimidazol reductase NimA-like FMN-containing flavoprotein (pyridoxamine 5'-phosphate oxidase superfamily)
MAGERLEPTERSRVRRLHERGSHELATIAAILDAGLVAHVGYVIDGEPYVTPTAYWREGSNVYWHGSRASRAIRAQHGLPVCLTVTHLDGLVLARSGFHHSLNYRSVMLFGRARAVADPAAKRAALDAFVDRILPGRAAALRPPSAPELKATTVMVMALEEGSAKLRTGPPKDEEADYALPIWAGVVPLRLVPGAIQDDPRLLPGLAAPEHVRRLVAAGSLDAALAAAARAVEPAAA